jgi:hypothetical protein
VRYLFRIVFLAALVGLVVIVRNSFPIRHAPGVLVPMTPVQEDVAGPPLPEAAGFKLSAVARYALRARVLGTKRYWSGLGAELVPVDVALGWGPMSDQAVLDGMRLSMSNRFFFYEWQTAPAVAPAAIASSSSNNHVIAANSQVARAVKALRTGQIAHLEGWLVDATGPGGFVWRTSRRRDDTGNGACELFYVEQLVAVDRLEVIPSPAVAVVKP